MTTDSAARVSEMDLGPIRTSIPWREEEDVSQRLSEPGEPGERVTAERSSDRSKRKSISSFTSEEERAPWPPRLWALFLVLIRF